MDFLQQTDGDNDKYTSVAIKITLGVSSSALRRWTESGRIVVVYSGGNGKRLNRRRDVEWMFNGYRSMAENSKEVMGTAKRGNDRICDARVSSAPQKDDLERQIKTLQKAHPEHQVANDIASNINWKRAGIISILDRAMCGYVEEVVIIHHDCLCRFAFELVGHVLECRGGVRSWFSTRMMTEDPSAKARSRTTSSQFSLSSLPSTTASVLSQIEEHTKRERSSNDNNLKPQK